MNVKFSVNRNILTGKLVQRKGFKISGRGKKISRITLLKRDTTYYQQIIIP